MPKYVNTNDLTSRVHDHCGITINKSFSSETAFASLVLLTTSIQIMFDKIIESFIEAFKIMHFNNARTIIVDKVQKIVNVILCRQSITLSVNVSVDFEQISI